jgi:hypothetical protein
MKVGLTSVRFFAGGPNNFKFVSAGDAHHVPARLWKWLEAESGVDLRQGGSASQEQRGPVQGVARAGCDEQRARRGDGLEFELAPLLDVTDALRGARIRCPRCKEWSRHEDWYAQD